MYIRSTCWVVSDSGSLLDSFAVYIVRCRTDYIVDFSLREYQLFMILI